MMRSSRPMGSISWMIVDSKIGQSPATNSGDKTRIIFRLDSTPSRSSSIQLRPACWGNTHLSYQTSNLSSRRRRAKFSVQSFWAPLWLRKTSCLKGRACMIFGLRGYEKIYQIEWQVFCRSATAYRKLKEHRQECLCHKITRGQPQPTAPALPQQNKKRGRLFLRPL